MAFAFSAESPCTTTFTSIPISACPSRRRRRSDSALCAVAFVTTITFLDTLTSAAIVSVKVAFVAAPKSSTVRPMSETDMRTSSDPLSFRAHFDHGDHTRRPRPGLSLVRRSVLVLVRSAI